MLETSGEGPIMHESRLVAENQKFNKLLTSKKNKSTQGLECQSVTKQMTWQWGAETLCICWRQLAQMKTAVDS